MTLPPWYVDDPEGGDLRPDPDKIRTVAELTAAMRAYRIWAGNVSYRKLSSRCLNRVSPSAFHAALNKDRLPSAAVVSDFIGACGATEEYRRQFDRAWRRVALLQATR